ncbi:MAG: DMT family transporter [Actinobacteria bacterium]|jgi:drug/metabolite transporter (DMT)-like permease|nr:DMT family transporter [Actinomycetota bacterium]MCL6094365.1 DMT family transporter [Actinomycetota bacterium]
MKVWERRADDSSWGEKQLGTRREERSGLLLASTTALISGVAIFVDSYGTKDFSYPTVYTTAKNLVAALLLCLFVAIMTWRRRQGSSFAPVATRGDDRTKAVSSRIQLLFGCAYVGIVGGGLAFVAFFDGLSRTPPLLAGFEHDTLVVWVAIMAFAFLGERLSRWNMVAIAVLVAGSVLAGGGVGHLTLGRGSLLILAATVAWSIEVVVSKRLLRWITPTALGAVRMGVGTVVLFGYLAYRGYFDSLFSIDSTQLLWATLTGMLLAGYVATWLAALKRSRAVDVTSVLVASVVVTAALSALDGHVLHAPRIGGLVLVALGVGATLWLRTRHRSIA